MTRFPVTPEGYAVLTAELRHQKEVVRPGIVRDIEEARAHGDISENSEYEDAKERQALTEGRVRELEGRVAAAEIIDVSKLTPSDRVVFGTTVDIENSVTGELRTWRIVGESEASVEGGSISYKSPLGGALIGRSEGEEVTVPAPGGKQAWEIVEVRYE
ncbi:MAG: transcription elongation factor GreA [Myxococcota bacterium]|jgi:transcription elongation factor GreA